MYTDSCMRYQEETRLRAHVQECPQPQFADFLATMVSTYRTLHNYPKIFYSDLKFCFKLL